MNEKRRLVAELHSPARRNYPRRRVLIYGYDDLWQADVVEMRPYARINQGYHYILTIIDALSKYAWAVPLKNKSGSEVSKKFSQIFQERYPKNLQTDRGKEFYNADVKKVLAKYNISHYSTYSVMKASIVERFNRTLKEKMWKLFTLNGNYKWIDILQQLISDYNMQKHRTIKMRPIDVTPKIAEKLLSTVYSHIKIAAPGKFHLGDLVRISKFKTVFAKGYTPNWTTEVFKIMKVQRTNPVTYLLEDSHREPIAGGFYEHELQRTAYPDIYLIEKIIRRNKDKVYVKWLGFDDSHNSWIDNNQFIEM